MTLSNFSQHVEHSETASSSPPASWIRGAAPRNSPRPWPHEIEAAASHFARMAYRPFRGLPWAQGVAGSNPVAPTTCPIGVTLSSSSLDLARDDPEPVEGSKGRPDQRSPVRLQRLATDSQERRFKGRLSPSQVSSPGNVSRTTGHLLL